MTALEIDVVTDAQGLAKLEPEWRGLYARLSDPHSAQSFDWAWRAWECAAAPLGRRLHVVVGRREGRAVLIWPLTVYRQRLWRAARWLGSDTSEYRDVLVDADDAAPHWLEQAWRAVRATSGADFVYFDHVRADAAVAGLAGRQPGAWSSALPAPFVCWRDWPSWDAYYESRSGKLRRELRRVRRRLEECGTLRFELVDDAEEVAGTLLGMLEQKSAAFERDETPTWLLSPPYRAFLRAIVEDARASGGLVMARLRLDDRTLAANLCFRSGGRCEGVLASYDPEWRSHAPGLLLLRELLQWSCENGVSVFDFRIGAESYKYDWTERETAVATHLVPCTLWGRVYLAWARGALRSRLRRVRKRRTRNTARVPGRVEVRAR